ncbi:2-succinylbenzoate--CoA ligase [Lusitaniella coriacea LEGE 07157]|uniref:2-succinylbenzoate--CoA ligase n=1 Tax=Lusitaniella coriacea LEGE 07157 TaxID=945747 RepID=A0A8J7DY05_9CYAN|nr:2-succinylbenzoate--CoA ligase [Lusitaniella coriacea]MBE9117577.1 2-succinylbenzoate--CoA ligase [Lusitaniella coriacea LEGE 07157]
MNNELLKSTEILEKCEEIKNQKWLIGHNFHQFDRTFQDFYQKFKHQEKRSKILLVESSSLRFLAIFLAAVAADCPLFLCNPNWRDREWEQVLQLVQPDIIVGQVNSSLPNFKYFKKYKFVSEYREIVIGRIHERWVQSSSTHKSQWDSSPPPHAIMIPTGGSSGKIRFAIHTWETLSASVRGFCQYFEQEKVNSFCVLPLYHVSGLMQFMRSFTTGGKLLLLPYKSLKSGEKSAIAPQDWFISLVPTQLQFLLKQDASWLAKFDTVLLGGAPAWDSLLNEARANKISLAPTYGMTETASQVMTLKPHDFLQKCDGIGRVLPHARVKILGSDGEQCKSYQTGIITLQGDSLFLGYYPQLNREKTFKTDDLGYFDDAGYFYVVGRNSRKIITGGENVFPAEVEAAILGTEWVKDVCAIGVRDRAWGEIIVAVYVPQSPKVPLDEVKSAIAPKLSRFKHPKEWIETQQLPRNDQGKVNYQAVREIALHSLAR